MKGVLLFISLGLCIFLVSCAPKELRVREYSVSADTPDPAKAPEELYVIGFGDVLNVNLWKEPSLSGPAKVRPDGYITLPLINEVQVVGLTTTQARKLLEEKYREFTANPFVTVRVEGIASREVFLVGQVNRPGPFPLGGNDTVLQLLARAGGFTIFARRDKLRVVRREGEKVTEFMIDYDAILEGDLKQDILLKPGDRIIVP